MQVLPGPLSHGHTISSVTKHHQPKIMARRKQSHHRAIFSLHWIEETQNIGQIGTVLRLTGVGCFPIVNELCDVLFLDQIILHHLSFWECRKRVKQLKKKKHKNNCCFFSSSSVLIITILFTTYCFGKFRMSKALQGTIYPYIVKLKSSLLMLQIVCKSWVFAFWHSVAYFAWIFVKTVTKVYITISRNALCRFCNLEKLRLYWGSGKYYKFIYS